MQPGTGSQGHQHVQAEFVPFSAHEVGHAGLADAQGFGCLGLRPLALFDGQACAIMSARMARMAASSGGKPRSAKTLPLEGAIFSFMVQSPVA